MEIAALWRYPVKSLGGEPLQEAQLTADGVSGDRLVHVAGPRGPLTGRTRHQVLRIPVSTDLDGVPLVGRRRWDSPEAAAILHGFAGPDAHLVAYSGPERFDVLNLLVATDGAVAQLGHDVRRLRPNILIGGVADGEVERDWPGRALAVGDALIGIHSLRERCIVTTIDPDSGAQDLDVLRAINAEFDGRIALNSWVIKPGTIRVGDPVTLVRTTAQPEHYGGWIVGAPYAVGAAG
jgi:uncharacterized protein YcbX